MINLSLLQSGIIFSFYALSSYEKIYRFLPTTSILIANQYTLNNTCSMLRTIALVIFLVISSMYVYVANNSIFPTELVYAQVQEQEQKVSSTAEGRLQCSNGFKTYEGKIYFLAIEDSGPVYGTYEIIVSNTTLNGSIDNTGSLMDGNISSSQYRLFGSESKDNICGKDNAFATVTIIGECGPASSIDVLASGDYSAKFVGDVDCPPPRNTGFPIAKATGPIEIAEGEKAILSGAGSIDPDGDPLLYQWKQIGGATVDLIDPGSVETEFTVPSVAENSTLTFELTVDDSRGGTDTNSINIKVYKKEEIELNKPPSAVADASPRTLSSAQDTEVVLYGTQSSDPDGDSLSYSWKQIGGPAIGLSNSGDAKSTFNSDIEAEEDVTLTFELTVDDGRGGVDSDNVDITIKAEDSEPEEPQTPPNGVPGDGEEPPEPEPEPEPE